MSIAYANQLFKSLNAICFNSYTDSPAPPIYTPPAAFIGKSETEFIYPTETRVKVGDSSELLRKYDTVILLDDSSSMKEAIYHGTKEQTTRWKEARKALAELASIAGKYDSDGIDIYFLNNTSREGCNLKTKRSVQRLFRGVKPEGFTPTGARLEWLLNNYFSALNGNRKTTSTSLFSRSDKGRDIKPINCIVITDGEASDSDYLEDSIVRAAKRLDNGNFPIDQIGIQFVQIGNSATAAEALRILDTTLKSKHPGMRDIVDTAPYSSKNGSLTEEMLLKILLGGVNRHFDQEGEVNY